MRKYISRFLIACFFIIAVNHAFASENVNKSLPRWQVFSYEGFTPLQLSVLNTQLFSGETPVYGANLNFGFGNSQKSVSGITLGVVNYEFGIHNGIILGGFNSCDKNNGVAFGIINECNENNGIAVACLVNLCDDDSVGSIAPLNIANDRIFQVGIVNCPMLLDPGNGTKYQVGVINFTKKGILQVAIVNYSEQGSLLQLGCFNATDKNASLQIGCFNGTGKNNGVQIGCFNVAESRQVEMLKEQEKSKGWQLGIFNISENYGVQIGLVNYNKNALIPWFPLFNFSFPPSSDKTAEGRKSD